MLYLMSLIETYSICNITYMYKMYIHVPLGWLRHFMQSMVKSATVYKGYDDFCTNITSYQDKRNCYSVKIYNVMFVLDNDKNEQ
jgi:hypothetical protein